MATADPTLSAPPPPPALEPETVPAQRSFATFRTISALMVREMTTTYGRSPGGYAWAILQPVGAIAVMSFAFSLALRNPPLGTNFLYFYASGYLIFQTYQDTMGKTSQAIKFSRSLLAYPAVTYADALIARFLLAMITHAVVIVIVIAGIIWWYGLGPILRPGYLVEGFLLAGILGLGIGTLNCLLSGLYPVWERVWNVLTRPMFVISGVFFTFQSLGSQAQDWFWYNPVIHLVGMFRAGLYVTYDPFYVSATYVLGFALVPLVIGLVFLNRYQRDIINGR